SACHPKGASFMSPPRCIYVNISSDRQDGKPDLRRGPGALLPAIPGGTMTPLPPGRAARHKGEGGNIMMRAKTEHRVKRWNDQRWLLDSVIQAVGMEWDQPRLAYTLYPCGPAGTGDFRPVGMRVRKFADMHREFAAAARRREVKAEAFEKAGRVVAARESYFIASLLWS